jgi:hypothetical protein
VPDATTYRERLEDLTGRATYVGVRSGAIYGYETWIRQGHIDRVLGDLLARGARMEIGPAAPDSLPLSRPAR